MLRRRSSLVAMLALALSAAHSAAAGQSALFAGSGANILPTSLPAWRAGNPDSLGTAEITLPSATASGAPRSYQVVSISIPDQLARSTDIQLEIVPHGDFMVLGPRTRTFAPSGKKRIGVTIGIPASALAGRLLAGEARFSAAGLATFVVPMEIDVNLVRKVSLHPGPAPLRAQAGNDVILPFEIRNSGNANEKLSVDLDLPSGWASRELRHSPLAIEPGETIKKRIRLTIPALSSTGSSFVRIALRSGDDTLDDQTMTVEVFNSGSTGSKTGPLITTAVARTSDENGRPNSLATFTATGALFDSVRIDARMTQGSVLTGGASNAFAHLGAYQSAASVALSSPSAQLNLGNTGASFSDLTGLYPYGQGALLHVQHPDWSFIGLGARSLGQLGTGAKKPMLGLRTERRFGDILLSTSASHLQDAGPSPRKLEAVGIGAAMPAIFGSTFKAELADRSFQGGSGIGWSSGLLRTTPESNEEFRVTHAPGGSDAFARAANELVANVSERLTPRASVSASAWRTTDATSVFSGLSANGLSVRPQYEILSNTTLAIEARSYAFDATSRPSAISAADAFGNREQQLGIGMNTTVRQYYLNSSAYLGNVTRTVSPVGQSMTTDRTPRNYWATNAGWSGAGGILEVHSRIEQTRDRGGFVNQQTIVGVRADELVIPHLGGVRAGAELQHVSGFGDDHSSIARGGFAIPIMNGLSLKVDAERNSIFHSASGGVPWIIGFRLEHALTVPMLRAPGTSGYVYEDLNGNQRRDAGEPGVSGAVVRRGGETATADATGKYRVAGDPRQSVVVDETSLPDGWTANGAGREDLSVTLSTSAEVELVVAPRSGISDVQVDLGKAHILARDSAGHEWAAKMTGPTTATFDALPIGTYTLEFDLSELTEPLVPRGPLGVLVINGKDSKSITITLDPRPIRMWNGSGSHGGGEQKNNSGPQKNIEPVPEKAPPVREESRT